MIRPGIGVLGREVRRLFGQPRAVRSEPGAVGVELELIPVRISAKPPRLRDDRMLDRLVTQVAAPGRFSFEPGGQIEYATSPLPTMAALCEEIEAVLDRLCGAARTEGLVLAARGLAPWFGPDEIGLRRPTARYEEMDRYFEAIGPWGRWMMRLTASLQVNLDFGPPATASRRWRVASSLGPLLTGVFANSAAEEADGTCLAAGRAAVWSRVDPGRTGAVTGDQGSVMPWARYLAFALRAGVMFDADMRPVRRPYGETPSFGAWWEAGEPGRPRRAADWRTHLTTLFPDVRPRGRMEIRSIDVPERAWWAVPPALLAALLYDDDALAAIDELLAGIPGGSSELAERAVRLGLRDDVLRDAAGEAFRVATAAMDRFPDGWFGGTARRATAAFRERYVETGRTQADEARERGEVAHLPSHIERRPIGLPTAASLPPRFS